MIANYGILFESHQEFRIFSDSYLGDFHLCYYLHCQAVT